ncbi:hypothetical protein ACS127_10190 [Amphibacillus sp. Q70]|uniref:hypothetical protein n=1 Tax=Amphibacillus sp. Q70 TaxID=3453416 RepID=UPI003F85BAAA
MNSIQELQAFDFLLKKITQNKSFAISSKNLKVVLSINGTLWTGDLVQFNGRYLVQSHIDSDGDIDRHSYNSTAIKFIKEVMDKFNQETQPDHFFINPFKSLTELPLLFEAIYEIIKLSEIDQSGTNPLRKMLYNASCLNNNVEIPFYDLTNEAVKLISIIEVDS